MTANNPEFTVYVGPMFGSKTSRLLSQLERFKYQHKRVAVFKPKLDSRYSVDSIVTHMGLSMPAITIESGADVLRILAEMEQRPDAVAVDEAFMLEGIAEALIWLFRMGTSVVVSTLDLSATGVVFKEVKELLPWATNIVKCPAICTICGTDAYYTHSRQQMTGDEIQVGGAETYEPRCFSHHVIVNQALANAVANT